MKRAIVTGANGFIGKNVVNELSKTGYSVVALVHSVPEYKVESVEYIKFDLERTSDIADSLSKTDLLYHFAWDGSSGDKRNNVEIQMNNVRWTRDMVQLANNLKAKFIGAGSIMEIECVQNHIKNDCIPDNNTVYSAAKLFSHMVSKKEAQMLDVPYVWGMITNTFGPGEKNPRFINTTLKKIINRDELNFSEGSQIYDFLYITDLAKAFKLIGEKGKNLGNYLIGSGDAKPLKEYIDRIGEIFDYSNMMTFGKIEYAGKSLNVEDYNIDKLSQDTGFQPDVSFAEGIKTTYKWMEK